MNTAKGVSARWRIVGLEYGMKLNDVNADEINTWAGERIAKQNLPLPAKPRYEDPEFQFPDDPADLTMMQLGQLMLRFAGFLGYSIHLLGLAESELTLVESELNGKVAGLSGPVRTALGRVKAEVIENAVLSNNPQLIPLHKRRLELTAIITRLGSMTKIYEKMYQALSRDLARREVESRVQ